MVSILPGFSKLNGVLESFRSAFRLEIRLTVTADKTALSISFRNFPGLFCSAWSFRSLRIRSNLTCQKRKMLLNSKSTENWITDLEIMSARWPLSITRSDLTPVSYLIIGNGYFQLQVTRGTPRVRSPHFLKLC